MKDTKKKASTFRNIYMEDMKNLDNAIFALKKGGATLAECVVIIAEELNISLKEADGIILNSPSWSESKEMVENFRHHISQVLQGLDNISDL